MRLIVIAVAAFVASTPALAEGWEEYNYPEYAFAVSFPAAPAVQTMTYRAPGGRAVSAQVYTATADNTVFTMTVADLSGAEDSETAVIDNAIKQLTEGGDIKVDIPHRVRRVYGRQLSIASADGARTLAAVFFFKNRLYQIEGKALPGSGGTAGAIRFQQSLMFTDDATNRSDAGEGRGGRYAQDAGAAAGEGRRCRTADGERCRRRDRQGVNAAGPQ